MSQRKAVPQHATKNRRSLCETGLISDRRAQDFARLGAVGDGRRQSIHRECSVGVALGGLVGVESAILATDVSPKVLGKRRSD